MTPADIREARRKLGLSQTQLAAVMGLRGKQTVSEWERGVKSPDGQSVRLIQAYLAGHRPRDWPEGAAMTGIESAMADFHASYARKKAIRQIASRLPTLAGEQQDTEE